MDRRTSPEEICDALALRVQGASLLFCVFKVLEVRPDHFVLSRRLSLYIISPNHPTTVREVTKNSLSESFGFFFIPFLRFLGKKN